MVGYDRSALKGSRDETKLCPHPSEFLTRRLRVTSLNAMAQIYIPQLRSNSGTRAIFALCTIVEYT